MAQTSSTTLSTPTKPSDGGMPVQTWQFRSDLLWRWSIAAVLVLGVLLRAAQYIGRRSLWLDEGALAINFMEPGFQKLLHPFTNHQAAPLGFNVITECVVQLAGLSEFSLRFVPFLSGVASVFVFWQFSKRWLRGGALLAANYAFAISSSLVYYSNEFKPYGVDALLAMMLAWAVISWIEAGMPSQRLKWLALFGAATVWLSFPSIFVLGGLGIAALLRCWQERDLYKLRRIALMGGIWLLAFACQYALHGRHIAQMGDLTDYWRGEGAFMPFPPWKSPGLSWFTTSFFGYFHDVAGLHHSRNVWQFIFLCGVIQLVRSRATIRLVALLAPIALAFAASALERYPFQGRLILFTVPLALVVCGEGMAALLGMLRQHLPFAVALLGIAFFSPSAYSLPQLWHPVTVEEVRPITEFLERSTGEQGTVFVLNDNAPFSFYHRLLALPHQTISFKAREVAAVSPRISEEMRAGRRCWVFVSHVTEEERTAVISALQASHRLRPVNLQMGAELLAVEL